jgi:hypothetical protein
MLVGRWGILWRPLRVPIERAGQVFIVCMKFHNYIIERSVCFHNSGEPGITIPEPSSLDIQGHIEMADMNVHLQEDLDTDQQIHKRRRDLEASDLRAYFTRLIQDTGHVRPQV